MDRALKFLGPRARSRQEVNSHLEGKGFSSSVVRDVLTRLEELSILDDARLAEDIAAAVRAGGKGSEAARRHLLARGVPEESIEAVVGGRGPGDEFATAFEAGSRRLARLGGLPPAVVRRRLAGYLLRRGHDPDAVEQVCRRLEEDFATSD